MTSNFLHFSRVPGAGVRKSEVSNLTSTAPTADDLSRRLNALEQSKLGEILKRGFGFSGKRAGDESFGGKLPRSKA